MYLTINQSEIPRTWYQKLLNIPVYIKSKVAKRDIICYKRFFITDMIGILKDPYNGSLYINGRETRYICVYENIEPDTTQVKLRNGYLTQISLDNSELETIEGEVIYKCVIPKGSTYYIGNVSGINDSYLSNQIKIVEHVK